MLEKAVENQCCKIAEKMGYIVRKVQFVGVRGAPDRLFMKDGKCIFIEFKAPGRKARLDQEVEHENFRKAGIAVHVIDNLKNFLEIINE